MTFFVKNKSIWMAINSDADLEVGSLLSRFLNRRDSECIKALYIGLFVTLLPQIASWINNDSSTILRAEYSVVTIGLVYTPHKAADRQD